MDGYLVKKLIERIQIGYRDLGGWMDGHGRRLQVGPRSTEPVNRPLAAQVTVPGARSPHQRPPPPAPPRETTGAYGALAGTG
jgi:hypothetical protein